MATVIKLSGEDLLGYSQPRQQPTMPENPSQVTGHGEKKK
jgi:hypothetical protein